MDNELSRKHLLTLVVVIFVVALFFFSSRGIGLLYQQIQVKLATKGFEPLVLPFNERLLGIERIPLSVPSSLIFLL